MIKFAPAPQQRQQQAPPTSEQLVGRQRLAQALMNEGSSSEPVQHWMQGIARVAQAGLGAYENNQIGEQMRVREDFDEKQAGRRRIAASEQAFQDKRRWEEYQRTRPKTEFELADLDYKKAQAEKLRREAAEAGTTYGKNGAVFQDATGRSYTVQFGADGTRMILPVEFQGQAQPQPQSAITPYNEQPMENGGTGRFAAPGIDSGVAGSASPVALSPSRGVDVVGDTLINKGDGSVVRNVGPNLSEAERMKTLGRETGQGQAAFPKAQMAYRLFEDKSTRLEKTIDQAISRVNPYTTGMGGLLSNLPQTEARALAGDLDTIRANVGFEELQAMRDASPTGGALGQVSEMENRLLQSVRASIDQLQAGENVKRNLEVIKDSVQQIRKLQKEKMDKDTARFGGQQAAPQEQRPDPLGLFGGN